LSAFALRASAGLAPRFRTSLADVTRSTR
jgi:hypothetical protein